MSVVFNYNEDQALKAGGGMYINASGAYVGNLTAKWTSSDSGAQFLELGLKGDDGEANYMRVCYVKKDGTANAMGENLIQAIMGLLKLKSLSQRKTGDDTICPELTGKPIGLVLQKVLFTKNDGSDGYKFDIKFPFSPTSRKTLKEALNNTDATAVDSFVASLKDKDERHNNGSHRSGDYTPSHADIRRNHADALEDDIPF